jgi:uncharacterized membrane protein
MTTTPDNVQYRKEFTKPALKTYPRRQVFTFKNNDIWAADIADLSYYSNFNKNYKYLLCVMDIYSRYVYVFPLKDKKGSSIIKCFKELRNYGCHLWVDQSKIAK